MKNLSQILFAGILLSFFFACNTQAPEVPQTCIDGIENQDEDGVDCGGPCPACPTCVDGIQNQGEAGIDCDGPCTLGCFVQPACTLAVNTLDIHGLPLVTITSSSRSVDFEGNIKYRLQGNNSTSATLTFSQSYNFVTSGMFDLGQYTHSGQRYELTLNLSTASQVYNVSPGKAAILIDNGFVSVFYCNLYTGNQNISTESDAYFNFPIN